MNTVAQLWPAFSGGDVSAQVNRIEIDKDRRHLFLSLFCDQVDDAYLQSFAQFIRATYAQYQIEIEHTFARDAFNATACRYLIDRLTRRGVPINGFFNGCDIQIDGDNVEFVLTHGGLSLLHSVEFARLFCAECGKHFGFTPKIEFGGVTELETTSIAAKLSQPTAGSGSAKKEKEPRRGKCLSEAELQNSFLALADEQYELVMGGKPSFARMQPLEKASLSEGKCTVIGEVFSTEIRETRNRSTVYTVGITDFTGSVYLKVMEREGKASPIAKLQEGDTVVVSGTVKESEYDKDYILTPRDIIKVHPKQKQDAAPQKRVELHLHTNMSSMDALPPVKKVIDRALAYGHRAVAITDHGVVQAFPDAQAYLAKIRKANPDFKVIYGVECYYVDDTAKVVFGHSDAAFDGEFVCFDLETTGLSAQTERIDEIGAVLVRNGEIVESFGTFVNPEKPIPPENTEITGITNDMVKDAPLEAEALHKFLTFAGDRPLVAHNAAFDMSFLHKACRRQGIERAFVALDTLALSQVLLPELKRHRLDSLTKHFKLQSFQHHRANDDAAALARIFAQLIALLRARQITTVAQINETLGGRNVKHVRPNHMILLVQNKTGLKNLYQLITKSHLDYFANKRPRIPRSELLKHRDGLLVGSACEAGEIYTAILEGRDEQDLLEKARLYDYFEIQPRGNNLFLVDKGTLPDEAAVLDINRKIVALADKLGKPVVATGDVHYLDRRDAIYRDIISNGPGFEENNSEQSLDFKTTDEMLAEFGYLGEETAQRVVIDNPNAIAALVDGDIQPIPAGTFTPQIDGASESLREMVEKNVAARYGTPEPFIRERIEKELASIIGNDYAVLYVIAEKLVSQSERDGYHVGSRGSVGSSFIANLIGISEVNPLPPHYLCKDCRHFEFSQDAGSGFDLSDKRCPQCGAVMTGDGHDIPFETFLGFEGEKQPDIDLNFSGEYQSRAHRYTETLFGSDHVFKAGTISALKEKTAFGYVKKYLEERGVAVSRAEENRMVRGCTGVKRTTGQHPGGMVVIPRGYDITDFTPAQHPADNSEQGVVTTHFDFTSLHDTLLKLDELGHDVPTMYKHIEDLTGLSVNDVPMNDPEVLRLFTSPAPLGVTETDIDSKTGTFGIPEMGTVTVRNLLIESQPKTFSDLVQVSGLSHGTDVWAGNAQTLIKEKVCTIKDVIGTRDSIMVELIKKGVTPSMAFEIMELTRKGKAAASFTDAHIGEMRKNKVPNWYIESCKKIKYMFPKAHAAAYVTAAIRLAWFKLYHPLEFYATYFTVRGSDIDIDAAVGGERAAKRRLNELKAIMRDESKRTPKDEETYIIVQILCEMLCRGYQFLPVNFGKSHATKYLIEDGKLRLPYVAMKGVGENAANAIYAAALKGGYLSAEDMLSQPGITPSLIDALDAAGALGDLPKTSQLSFF